MRSLLAAVWHICVFTSACSPRSAEIEREAIIALYEAQRAAHYQQDPGLFLAAVDSGYLSVANGAVAYRSKQDAIESVGQYLARTRFEHVRDIALPRVELSPDGRVAWLIGEVEVRAIRTDSAGTDQPFTFRSAWLDVYEKREDGWRLASRANTQRDVTQP